MNDEKIEGMYRGEHKDSIQDKTRSGLSPGAYCDQESGQIQACFISDGRSEDQNDRDHYPLGRIFKNVLSSLPGMAYQCRFDKSWTMEFLTEGCVLVTGYLPNELIQNEKISYGQLIHPDDRASVWNTLKSVLSERRSYEMVYRIQNRTGDIRWVRDIGNGLFTHDEVVFALEGFIQDISNQKHLELQAQRQIQRYEAMRKIDAAITASTDVRVPLLVLVNQVITQLEVDAADVLLFNPETQRLVYAVGSGFHTAALEQTNLGLGDGYAGKAALERRTLHVADLSESIRSLKQSPLLARENFITYFAVPLIARGQIKGVLEVFHRSRKKPDREWIEFLDDLGSQAAIAIDNKLMFDNVQRFNIELALAYDATLEGWSMALELRDQETEGHARRVVDLTLRLSRAMGLHEDELVHVRRGAWLHDVGKMGIPDSILFKKGPLNDLEWEVMRRHPVYAYELLSRVNFLKPALDIPYCHHERWNGTGYPRGLEGENIPLSARIFSVVDVWDALLSRRPYRPAWPENEVFDYIQEQTGELFDPKVVRTFFVLMRRNLT